MRVPVGVPVMMVGVMPMPVRVGPLAMMVVMVLRMDRDAQPVQSRPRHGFGMKMQMLREKRVDGLLDLRDVRTQGRERGEDHVAACAADAVEPDVFFHGYSIPRSRALRNLKNRCRTDRIMPSPCHVVIQRLIIVWTSQVCI